LVVRLGVLALLALVAVYLVTALRVWQVAREDHRGRVDAIVVLGAAQFDGRPSKIFQARLDHAAALYRDDVAPLVVTVGGNQAGDRTTEAAAGAAYLRERGVDEVRAVATGDDTLSSLRAAARELAEVRTVVVVTDPWHSLRARRIARDVGFEANTSPTRSGPAVQSRATQVRYIARESAAYLVYRVFGRGSGGRRPNAV
jgi:vancomycin permeability regulator SanA